MSVTALYRRQHSDIVELTQEISGRLGEDGLSGAGAVATRDFLTKLAGKLLVHLATEDNSLYPKMIASGDREISETAKKFQDEMGGLKEAFEAYYARWNRAEQIENDPAGFTDETKAVFEALASRVQRENTILYPLADRL